MLENELFWRVINTLVYVLDWAVIYITYKTLSKPKTSKVVSYCMIGAIILSGLLMDAFHLNPNIKVVIHIILSFILYKFNFEVSIQKGILVVLTIWMMFIGIEAVAMSFLMSINGANDIQMFLDNGIHRLESMIITKGLVVLILLLLKSYKISVDIKNRDLLYISVPIITNIVSLLITFNNKREIYSKMPNSNADIVLLTVLVLISNIFIMLLIGKIIRENKLSLENKFIKGKIKTQYEYYERMKEKQFRTRQLYHDMKNHLACIERLNNSNESSKYINNIKQEIYKLENNFDTGNMILDIVLDEKYGICEERNITFVSKVDARQMNFIEDIDICSIFSNALDNSIEACDKIIDNDKNISIVSTYIKNFFIIKIENNKINEIILNKGKINTNKKDKLLHGIGIESIKQTVEKYEGEVVIDYSENNFVLKIMIPLLY